MIAFIQILIILTADFIYTNTSNLDGFGIIIIIAFIIIVMSLCRTWRMG